MVLQWVRDNKDSHARDSWMKQEIGKPTRQCQSAFSGWHAALRKVWSKTGWYSVGDWCARAGISAWSSLTCSCMFHCLWKSVVKHGKRHRRSQCIRQFRRNCRRRRAPSPAANRNGRFATFANVEDRNTSYARRRHSFCVGGGERICSHKRKQKEFCPPLTTVDIFIYPSQAPKLLAHYSALWKVLCLIFYKSVPFASFFTPLIHACGATTATATTTTTIIRVPKISQSSLHWWTWTQRFISGFKRHSLQFWRRLCSRMKRLWFCHHILIVSNTGVCFLQTLTLFSCRVVRISFKDQTLRSSMDLAVTIVSTAVVTIIDI